MAQMAKGLPAFEIYYDEKEGWIQDLGEKPVPSLSGSDRRNTSLCVFEWPMS